jgi:threonine dehydrogenase-like Zn-dependent dehydrogenase
VGAHAVARAAIEGPAAIAVIGCGPIGLAVIAALKARGLGPVIGLDYSPGRRGFAESLGADEVVDPAVEPLKAVWARHGAGKRGPRAVAFESIGRPGALQTVIEAVPGGALVVGVGNALEASTIDQVMAFNKELDIRFSMNFTPAEFRATLDDIAEGRIATGKVLTSVVRPEEAAAAFETLKDPERQAKIVVSFE